MTSQSTDDESAGDVSRWITGAELGDQDSIARLWEHCLPRLLAYSRTKLPDHLRRILDEEDVALSAFKSFCLRAADGTLGEITGQDELWKLLYCITSRKANGYIRHQSREKRGAGRVGGESAFLKQGENESIGGIDQVVDGSASPAMLAEFENSCRHRLDQLDDSILQTVALLRLEGYSVDEIAQRLGCAKRSIERRLNLIRAIWQSDDNHGANQA
ncbi:ECF-type sigma factor [Stieleria sp. ICT_E10.1]|uniref:ECF-type sigma factor n=1 Tax=Stieleria sedimenti TaxID=2976331 RepID=UPI0021802FFD|nr:ECF-type sigma factor [Stieleria sedimenti]MCS7469441.1 ECF-type sigma factor [Stieleria sedimenti]